MQFTEKEEERDNKFRKKHYKKCGNSNKYNYETVGTGVGLSITIVCPICKKKKDITDYDAW